MFKKIKNRKVRAFVTFLCCALAGALLCAGFLHMGGNDLKTNYFEKELNEKNLIDVKEYMIESEKTDVGVEIKVDEDTGVIKLSGKATQDHVLNVCQVELEAGTYTISGYDSASGRCVLRVLYDVDQEANAGTKTSTFILEEAQVVTVQIEISKDASFNIFTGNKFEPCLVSGDKEGSIYAD